MTDQEIIAELSIRAINHISYSPLTGKLEENFREFIDSMPDDIAKDTIVNFGIETLMKLENAGMITLASVSEEAHEILSKAGII